MYGSDFQEVLKKRMEFLKTSAPHFHTSRLRTIKGWGHSKLLKNNHQLRRQFTWHSDWNRRTIVLNILRTSLVWLQANFREENYPALYGRKSIWSRKEDPAKMSGSKTARNLTISFHLVKEQCFHFLVITYSKRNMHLKTVMVVTEFYTDSYKLQNIPFWICINLYFMKNLCCSFFVA